MPSRIAPKSSPKPKQIEEFDILLEQWAESTANYGTTLPTQRRRNTNEVVPLPTMLGKPFIRAQQPRQRHRYQTCYLAAGRDYPWKDVWAPQQAFQGGFMLKELRLSDVERYNKNPPVVLFGTANVPGRMFYGNLLPRDQVTPVAIPVVRGDWTEEPGNRVSDEASESFKLHRELHEARRPYTDARVQRDRKVPAVDVLEALADRLEAAGRDEDAKEVRAELAKNQNDNTVKRFLDKKHDDYKKLMDTAHVPNVEIRQAFPGYNVIPQGTIFLGRHHGIRLQSFHLGLLILALYQRTPTLGGHAATGGGAYLRSVYRISLTSDPDSPPEFDCLLRVEPFKPLMICLQDHPKLAGVLTWDDFDRMTWRPLRGANCIVSRAVAAWDEAVQDRSQFDLDFVARAQVETTDDDDQE